MMKNAKSLLKDCIKCWCEITCTDEKRMKRNFANYCYWCFRNYMKEYNNLKWKEYRDRYYKDNKHKEYMKEYGKKYRQKKKELNKIEKEIYMLSDEYKDKQEEKRLHTYISKKRIWIIKWANKRWIKFDKEITTEYLYWLCTKQKWRCSMSWILMHCWTDIKYNTLSVDRKDNDKWYTKDNIQIVCYMYNVMKSTFTDNECIEFAKSIVKNI